MNPVYPSKAVGRFACFWAIATLFAAAPNARAQSTDKLNTLVQLHLGRTTVDQIATAISRQTGLVVLAADYLCAHTLTVEITGLSARDALEAITQIGGWVWKLSPPNTVIIEKSEPPTIRPGEIKDVAVAMQHALTPDLRVFLGVGQDTITNTFAEQFHTAAGDGTHARWRQLYNKLDDIESLLTGRILTALLPRGVTIQQGAGQSITRNYADLTGAQREDVSAALLMYELGKCAIDNPMWFSTLTGAFSDYQINPGMLKVAIVKDRLDFSTRTDFIVNGFPGKTEQHFGWSIGR